MGNRLSPELQKLLEERKLTRMRTDRKLIIKEVTAAKSDLKDAQESIERKKFKWGTIHRDIIRCSIAREPSCLKKDTGKRVTMHCL